MIAAIEIVLVILIIGSIVFYLACALSTRQFFAPIESVTEPHDVPVSILVPVCGLDAGAWDNWSAFCQQDYPDYEVLFGVMDLEDTAIPVLKQLVETFPNRAKIFVGLEPRGINYKESNLSYLLEQASHEIIILADSDIRVAPDYINRVTAPLADLSVGLVTCAYIGYDPQSLGAAIASLGRCFDFIPSLLLARIVDGGFRLAIGATVATRKSSLANFGGLHLNRIGADYNLGKRAAIAGYRVELSRLVLESDTGCESISEVFQRELRWARTIRFNRGFQYYTMVFCYGTVYCLPLLLVSGFSGWAIALTLTTIIIRSTQVLVAIFSIKCPKLISWLWALPLRDFINFAVWAMGTFGQSIYWRGRRLRVIEDGLLTQWE